jgi:hypothetical protein
LKEKAWQKPLFLERKSLAKRTVSLLFSLGAKLFSPASTQISSSQEKAWQKELYPSQLPKSLPCVKGGGKAKP